MLFSVIIPVYNVQEYLSICIDSVLNQTMNDYEIILVDDGSTDISGKICDQYALKYNFIKVVHKSNGGLSSAWVEGLKYAEGNYVCSIDSDDYVESDLFEKMKDKILTYSCDILVYGYKSIGESEIVNEIGCEGGYYDRKKIEKNVLPRLINIGNLRKRSCIYLSRINKTVKRELLLKNRKFYRTDISYGEDNMWTIPNVLTASSMYIFTDYYPYCYRCNPKSITQSYNVGLWEKFELLDKHVFYIVNTLGHKEMEKQIKCDIVFHAAIVINNEMFSNGSKRQIKKNINEILNNNNVIEGLKCMDLSSCTWREKILLYLMQSRSGSLLYVYKEIRSKTRKYIK